eukprot:1610358-Prorocentrum_lima.AAC.1
MTSSLVGSEMCIIDRPYYTTLGWKQSNGWQDDELHPRGHGIRGDQISSCLLYTSDAADDM